jgi:trk system potassium uptake protein TrkA
VHVVIVGAGEVGWYLAERLDAEHDVVVIEQDADTANAIGEDLDIQVVVGQRLSPSVLERAGIGRAALLAGVTQNDEVNLISSLLAKERGGAEDRPCAIQTEELRGPAGAGLLATMGADVVIDPDADTAEEILELVHLSGADEVYPMVDGDLVVLGGVIRAGSAVAGQRLSEVGAQFEPRWRFLFGAVTRRGETSIPRGDEVLELGDHVRILTTSDARREVLGLIGAVSRRVRRLMVLGGGMVGSRVAAAMAAEGAEVLIVERDLARAQQLAAELPRVRVIHGDITDVELLAQESVATMDVVVATSGEDTANVLACAFAAAEGSGFTVAVIHRLALLPLASQFGIDATLSPGPPRPTPCSGAARRAGSVATFLESDVEVNEFTVRRGEPGRWCGGRRPARVHGPCCSVPPSVRTAPWRSCGAPPDSPRGPGRRLRSSHRPAPGPPALQGMTAAVRRRWQAPAGADRRSRSTSARSRRRSPGSPCWSPQGSTGSTVVPMRAPSSSAACPPP